MRHLLLLLSLAVAPEAAAAAGSPCMATPNAIGTVATEALTHWRAWDFDRFRVWSDALNLQLPCAGSPVPLAIAADVHLVKGLRAALDAPGEDAPAAAASSLHAWRAIARPTTIPTDIAAPGSKYHRALELPAATDLAAPQRLAKRGEWWVDGVPSRSLPRRAALVQHAVEGKPLRTLYVDGNATRASALGPPHPGRGLGIAAASAASVACVSGLVAFNAYRDFREDPASSTADARFDRNQTAALVAAASGGLATGLATGAIVVRSR